MEIQIAQDIRKYKTKDIGNFSFKEVGIIALAFGVGYLNYKHHGGSFALNELGEVDSKYLLIPMIVILIIGFAKPCGMSVPRFFRTVVKSEMFSPRLYRNETDFEYNADEFEEIYGEKIDIPSCWHETDVTPAEKWSKEEMKKLIH